MLEQKRILLIPVLEIGIPFLFEPLLPAQTLLPLFRHRIPSLLRLIQCCILFENVLQNPGAVGKSDPLKRIGDF